MVQATLRKNAMKKKNGSEEATKNTMKTKLCKYCKTEIDAGAKICPNCKKKQGGFPVKGIIIALVVLALIGAAAGGNGNKKDENTANQSKKPTGQESQEVSNNNVSDTTADTEHVESDEPESSAEHYEVDLSAGNYTAGVDIPAGTYNLSATGGSGNVSSSNMYSGGLNEVMGNPADEYSIDSFNGLKLDDGVILTLGSTVTLHLVSENANVRGMTARSAADGSPLDFGAGNYTCGSDFSPGTYNVIATGGNGNVSSDNMFSGGLNEIMGTTNDGLSITQYNNAKFEDGTVLTVSGTSVHLVPVGE